MTDDFSLGHDLFGCLWGIPNTWYDQPHEVQKQYNQAAFDFLWSQDSVTYYEHPPTADSSPRLD